MRTLVVCLAAVVVAACGESFSAEDAIDCSRSDAEPSHRVEACDRTFAWQERNTGESGSTLAWRGQAKEALGDWVGAQRDYEASLAIAPELGGTLLGLGRVHLAQGDLAGAQPYLNRAIEENGSGIARDLLGRYALRQHDYAEALSQYEALIVSQPDNAIGFYGRGLARLGTGDECGHEDIARARAEWGDVERHFDQQGLAAPT